MKNLKKKKTGRHKQSSSRKGADVTRCDSEQLSEDKLDEALTNTFSASDPLPWTSVSGKPLLRQKQRKMQRKFAEDKKNETMSLCLNTDPEDKALIFKYWVRNARNMD